MRPIPRLLRALALPALLAACDGDDDGGITGCPRILPGPSLEITVTDSLSGAPLAAGASGYAVTGGTAVPLTGATTDDRLFAHGPAGTYSVVVSRAGYLPWARSGVRVRGDACGFPQEVVQLRARLQPSGAQPGGAR